MASRISKQLWSLHQGRCPLGPTSNFRDHASRFQTNPISSRLVPMEIDANRGTERGTTALAKTPAELLEYQRQGRCWGCGQVGHVCSNCPTNPSRIQTIGIIRIGERGRNWKAGKRRGLGLRIWPQYPGVSQTMAAVVWRQGPIKDHRSFPKSSQGCVSML